MNLTFLLFILVRDGGFHRTFGTAQRYKRYPPFRKQQKYVSHIPMLRSTISFVRRAPVEIVRPENKKTFASQNPAIFCR